MLKVVVFDGGWGGEIVADYLENELGVVEIIRVTDWANAPYDGKTIAEVRKLTCACLAQYMNKVDLVVLGGYTVSMTEDYLRQHYQHQKIVGVSINYYRILKSGKYPDRVTAIMSQSLLETNFCQDLRQNLPYSTIAIPDSSGWEEQTNSGDLCASILRADLEAYFELCPPAKGRPERQLAQLPLLEAIRAEKYSQSLTFQREPPAGEFKLITSDVVLLLNTNFWDMRADFEEVFGYKVRILDFREKLLHDVCIALDLLGLDGKRSK